MRRFFPLLITPGLAAHQPRHTCPASQPLASLLCSTTTTSTASSTMATASTSKTSLADWSFGEPRLASLPVDPDSNTIRSNVRGAVFSLARPTPWKSPPLLVASSPPALASIDLGPEVAGERAFLDWVGGNMVLEGSQPMAHRYGGHQFGHWAGQLGDGRAHLLGEYTNSKGERWELQLKGSGRTPYSRHGDGRAVLRSSIREFLCSEAMAALGVPTSRAAALVTVRDRVARDMFYDGRIKMEQGAVVLRLAPTWFRFGSFEILATNSELAELRQLADFVLATSFPHIPEAGEQGYLAMFQEVVTETAELIAAWTAVGFVHGVLNTDNMSIASLTIDYGPFGFVEAYSTSFTPNHSDDESRYDLGSQAAIGRWNLAKLATALRPLVKDTRALDMLLEGYWPAHNAKLLALWRAKLGLEGEEEGDQAMVDQLLTIMEAVGADFTQTFRDLGEVVLEELGEGRVPAAAWGLSRCLEHGGMVEWLAAYRARVEGALAWDLAGDQGRMEGMQATNPRYVLRNWVAQRAIELAEGGDYSEVEFLLELLQRPFTTSKGGEERGYAGPPPRGADRLAVSCSS